MLDALHKTTLRIYKHSKMHLLLQLIVLFLAFNSHEYKPVEVYVLPYSSLAIPINKHTDAAKPLYSLQIMASYLMMDFVTTNYLIDLDAPFIWHDCIVQSNTSLFSCPANKLCAYPVSCEDGQCTDFRTTYAYENPSCAPVTNRSMVPGWYPCTCPINVVNPLTGSCSKALLNIDDFTVQTSSGRNILTPYYGIVPYAACAPSSSFQSFPANVSGVMALSTSPYALPARLRDPLKGVMALCLPSTLSAPGVLLYFLPNSDVDVMSFLSYTPLIQHPDSYGYFVGIHAIIIKKRSIDIPMNSTTKLSTIDPYTTLRTDIYKSVIRRFSKVTKRIPPAEPVAPFGLCFNTSTNGDQVSLKVPDTHFVLQGGKSWTISTSNSIKQITKVVACLAFVDGGAASDIAIVIGTFQFEDNFLLFDHINSTLGFSSSLLGKQTSCSNFNFMVTDSN